MGWRGAASPPPLSRCPWRPSSTWSWCCASSSSRPPRSLRSTSPPTMNIFRFFGDMSHILSFIILLHKIVKGKSAAGISLRTQELYAIVFCSRYIDLFWNFSSMYNWFLKVIFIGCSGAIVYFMRFGPPQRATYDPEKDAEFPSSTCSARARCSAS